MNAALWIAAGVLAVVFLAAGLTKLVRDKADLVERMSWVQDASAGQVRAVGAVEVLGAIGVVLPALVGPWPWLVPWAATGLALVMVGAAVVNVRHHEASHIVVNAVLLVLALFVAWGRFGPYAF